MFRNPHPSSWAPHENLKVLHSHFGFQRKSAKTVCMLEENPGLKATLLHIHHVGFSVNEIFGKEDNTKKKHNVHERLIHCFMRPRISPGSSDVLGFPTTR